MATYQFSETQDWFSGHIERWEKLLPLVDGEHPRALEVGSWEGRSAVFLLEQLCGSDGEIVCIDHFDLFNTTAGRERFKKVNHNLSLTGKKFRIVGQFSVPGLMKILTEEATSKNPGFDWIYIDGSHEAADTMLDGELSWRLARKNAIFIFDDYHWESEPEDSIHHPRRGIDAFLLLHQGEFERVSRDGEYQMVIRKLTDIRIGFLPGNSKPTVGCGQVENAFGYGMHVALAIDSAYAVAAAVTIRSLVETTPSRMTIHVVDCGLTDEEKQKLQETMKGAKTDSTMVFNELSADSLMNEVGIPWARLDMLDVLPVQRVLYLDADILIRRNLRKLWETDLNGKPVGAVVDVGFPLGHSEAKAGPYFNSGVLLIDLAKVRTGTRELRELAKKTTNARFRDQDTLNTHFENDWFQLDLEWNAQGLGTYAECPSKDREKCGIIPQAMQDPSIVHFTGPVHPTLAEVLNPYVQPPTAKPWGYFGAKGHPFEAEWWSTLERTPWKGFRNSLEYKSMKEEQLQRQVQNAAREFKQRVQIT